MLTTLSDNLTLHAGVIKKLKSAGLVLVMILMVSLLTSCISLLPKAPTIFLGANESVGVAPFNVAFKAGMTIPTDQSKVKWAFHWDFGDGNTSTHPDIDHTFLAPGLYQVTLTISNDDDFETQRTLMITTLARPTFEISRYPTGKMPTAAGVLDLNLDQQMDMISANSETHNISVFHANNDGFLTSPYKYPAIKSPSIHPQPQSFAIGDVNNDSLLDLIVINQPDDNVTLMFGNGIGGFQTPSGYQIEKPSQAIVADFTGDGMRDIIVLGKAKGNNRLTMMQGRGTGEMTLGKTILQHAEIYDVVSADFDQDNDLDLIVAVNGFSFEYMLLENKDGVFAAPVDGHLPDTVVSMVSLDMQFDGMKDLAAIHKDGTLSLLHGNGSVKLSLSENIQTGLPSPTDLVAADLNGDRIQDLLICYGNADVAIMFGDGEGAFTQPLKVDGFTGGVAPVVADLNGDDFNDIVVVIPELDELLLGLNQLN